MSTHQQLLYHIVFSTKQRVKSLTPEFADQVYAYMSSLCQDFEGYAIIINGHLDHVHILVRIPAKVAIADFVGRVKANASKFINEKGWVVGKFHWQDGYGAFTVSVSCKDAVFNYIANQQEHHSKGTFEQEYLMLLQNHEVEYDPIYVFD